MKIVSLIDEVREIINKLKKENKTIGFVPTMGALHEGHLSLIKRSRSECDFTIVSIFVNPIQFGPDEDYTKYPRTLDNDIELSKSAGADLIYTPLKAKIIGNNFLTFLNIKKMQNNLCGLNRPDHFQGVLTIVAKLFNIVSPDCAYFGNKDIQQLYIIKKMTEDLNFNIKITGCPIIREKDGLAMSSRNRYLDKAERTDSLILYASLNKAKSLVENGENTVELIVNKLKDLINSIQNAKIDYVSIVNTEMENVTKVENGNILALAVYIGTTRLIDNYIFGENL